MELKDITPEKHLQYFYEFCYNVQQVGGATPHLAMVGQSCKDADLYTKLWRAGCYAAVYNYAGAEAVWQRWQPQDVLAQSAKFMDWLQDNWQFLPLRKERKAVNSTAKMARCVIEFANWHQHLASSLATQARFAKWYSNAWEMFTQVKFMGRYIAIRFLEFCRRYCDMPELVMPDIRPRDAQYPRESLSLFYPHHKEALCGNNSPYNVAATNRLARELRQTLRESFNLEIDYYTLQSLLCEYKQSVKGRRQYPARSVDSELKYYQKVRPILDTDKSQFFQVRTELFPALCLGEVCGWDGARDDLGRVLTDYGYTWSDLVYDYQSSKDSLEFPVTWGKL